MKNAWLPLALLLACSTEEPVVDSATTTEASTTGDDASTSGAPTTTVPATTDASSSSGAESSTGDDESTGVDPSTTTVADETSSDEASSTGEVPEGCAGIEMIELLDPYVTPIDAATWEPGGSVTVGVTMYNPGPDFLDYPSIVVESDDPLVTSAAPGNQLFAILEDQSVELMVTFDADDAIASGTEVTFTIRMAVLETVCPNGDAIDVQATVA